MAQDTYEIRDKDGTVYEARMDHAPTREEALGILSQFHQRQGDMRIPRFSAMPVSDDPTTDQPPGWLQRLNTMLQPLAQPQSLGDLSGLFIPSGIETAISAARGYWSAGREAAQNVGSLKEFPLAMGRALYRDAFPTMPEGVSRYMPNTSGYSGGPKVQIETTATGPIRAASYPSGAGVPYPAPAPSVPTTTVIPRLAGKAPSVEDAVQAALDDVRQTGSASARGTTAPGATQTATGKPSVTAEQYDALQGKAQPATETPTTPRDRRPVGKAAAKPSAPERARLTPDEVRAKDDLVQQGYPEAEVVRAILANRLKQSAAFANLPDAADVARQVADRNATGRWRE